MKPSRIHITGDAYVPVVARVVSHDESGRPRELVLHRDDEKIELKGGEEFLMIYVLEKCLRPTKN